MKVNDMRRLERAENTMLGSMCGASDMKLKDSVRSAELMDRLGIECVEEVVSREQLTWYGHIECKDKSNWVSAGSVLAVEETKDKVRGKNELVTVDVKRQDLIREDALIRDTWRTSGKRPTRPQSSKDSVLYGLRTCNVKL